jgi:integrase/recombinase XerD
MTWSPVSMPIEHWPEIDRDRWSFAQVPAGFLEDDKPAAHWSKARRVIVEGAYGRWLAFLDRQGGLEPLCQPGERATDLRLRASMIVGALLRMLTVLEPERDWVLLAQAYRHLKGIAEPSRDKLARMVPAGDLFELGIELMETWDLPPQRLNKASRYRNGLLIATLICCPIRLKNLAELVIGRHLICDGHDYRIELTAEETKTGRPYVADLPTELSPYVEGWLNTHRPNLQLIATGKVEGGGHCWIDCRGKPMSVRTIQRAIAWWTEQAFGKAIRPHLFRDCAVTELVDCAPEEIGIAPDLLGHADLRTTQRHYLQAQGVAAHARVQEVIVARRRAATARERSGA